MRIVLIGSGNVATVLGRKFLAAGHIILQVCSRNAEHAALLARELGASAVSGIDGLTKAGDIYILAISDDELYNLEEWKFSTGVAVAHTAGSVSMEVLKSISRDYGIFYPLQTLKKETDTINDIPILVDGSSEEVKQKLVQLAESVSENVQYAGDEERKKLHLAAVMVNNFSNHLYRLTEDYCKKENVDFKLLFPLIAEGAARLKHYSPRLLQTGPAIRHDLSTIERHKELLSQYPELLKIYELFTAEIIKG